MRIGGADNVRQKSELGEVFPCACLSAEFQTARNARVSVPSSPDVDRVPWQNPLLTVPVLQLVMPDNLSHRVPHNGSAGENFQQAVTPHLPVCRVGAKVLEGEIDKLGLLFRGIRHRPVRKCGRLKLKRGRA